MATLNQVLHRRNASGTYDDVYLRANLANVTGTLAVANGGTGATDAATARANLGAFASTGGTINGNVDLWGWLSTSGGIGFGDRGEVNAGTDNSTFTFAALDALNRRDNTRSRIHINDNDGQTVPYIGIQHFASNGSIDSSAELLGTHNYSYILANAGYVTRDNFKQYLDENGGGGDMPKLMKVLSGDNQFLTSQGGTVIDSRYVVNIDIGSFDYIVVTSIFGILNNNNFVSGGILARMNNANIKLTNGTVVNLSRLYSGYVYSDNSSSSGMYTRNLVVNSGAASGYELISIEYTSGKLKVIGGNSYSGSHSRPEVTYHVECYNY